MDIEFNVGDEVTYMPYIDGQKMLVRNISIGNPNLKDDDRVFYHLAVPEGEVVSITTGAYIKESKLYDL